MGRGKALKTKLKLIKAETKARYDAVKKWYEKNPQAWLQERLSDLTKQTSLVDATRLLAVVGMTVIVKQTIETTTELKSQFDEIVRGYRPAFLTAITMLPIVSLPFLPAILTGAISQPKKEKKEVLSSEEAFKWLLSFCFAWIIVNHFGDIMQGVGNVTLGVKGILSALLA